MGCDDELRKALDAARRRQRALRKPAREAKPLAEALKDYMASSGLARRYEQKDLHAAWFAAAGKEAAAHCRIVGVRKGVVHVLVDSAACLHEMANFRRKEILAGLRAHKCFEKVYDVEFRLGTLEQPK